MAEKALEYLYKELKKHKISLENADRRDDRDAVENLKNKIECVEFLIDLTIKVL